MLALWKPKGAHPLMRHCHKGEINLEKISLVFFLRTFQLRVLERLEKGRVGGAFVLPPCTLERSRPRAGENTGKTRLRRTCEARVLRVH